MSTLFYWQASISSLTFFTTFESEFSFYFINVTFALPAIFMALFIRRVSALHRLFWKLDTFIKGILLLFVVLCAILYVEPVVSYEILNWISMAIFTFLLLITFRLYVKCQHFDLLTLTVAQLLFLFSYLLYYHLPQESFHYNIPPSNGFLLVTALEILLITFVLFSKFSQALKPKTLHNDVNTTPDVENRTVKLNSLRYLFNNTIEGVILFKNDACIDINDEGLRLFGFYDKQKVLGKELSEFITHLPSVKSRSTENAQAEEVEAIKNSGETFSALYKSHYSEINRSRIQITSFVDLSSVKAKAENTTKAKAEFLAHMSHEIRTPMNGIIGMSHLMMQTKLNDKQKNFLKKIDDSAKSLLGVIDYILDYSKIEANKLIIENIPFDMHELIKHTVSLIQIKADKKDIKIIVNYNTSIDSFYGDSLRIGQILKNLLSNAVKFTQVGYVELTFEALAKNLFQFSVKDTGIGISEDKLNMLFQDFTQAETQTTRMYGESGLGLSISKQLAELMEGSMRVESEAGVGSTFIFELPLIELDKDAITLKTKNIDPNSINVLIGSKILLVDDNAINQEIILGLLENSGINIDVANNGEECIEKFKKNEYELILMDIHMPIMNGYEATLIIRETNKEIPIVALTANTMQEDVDKTLAVGMNEHLNKPIDVNKLYEVLLKYVSQKVESYETSEDGEKIEIPNFEHIDTLSGLNNLGGNRVLYLEILKDFYDQYKNFSFSKLADSKRKIEMHTLKSLSASIGATTLHDVVKRVDASYDENLLKLFKIELTLVLNELKNMLIPKEESHIPLLETSDAYILSLFSQLKDALKRSRPKNILTIIEEISLYKLSDENQEVFDEVKPLSLNYEYEKAEKLL